MSTGRCIECGSSDTSLDRGGDGHFRKHCSECGHVGGPYVSNSRTETGQAALDRFGA